MAPSRAPHCADWRLTRAVSSCCAGSQLPQGKAPYCGLGLRACAEICAFTLGLRLSSEPNFSPHLRRLPPGPGTNLFWRDCRFSSADEEGNRWVAMSTWRETEKEKKLETKKA
ncbi:uncharacterized protein ACOB8E_014826 [Sarcophilus harrisii]